jgi:hypothetical protein
MQTAIWALNSVLGICSGNMPSDLWSDLAGHRPGQHHQRGTGRPALKLGNSSYVHARFFDGLAVLL